MPTTKDRPRIVALAVNPRFLNDLVGQYARIGTGHEIPIVADETAQWGVFWPVYAGSKISKLHGLPQE